MSRYSFKNTMAEWESLLTAVAANQGEIPSVDLYAGPLKEAMEEIQEMRARRLSRQLEARELTRSLKDRRAQAYDLAIRLRSWVRGWYGAHNEKLTEFGVKPIRKRKRKGRAQDEAPRYPTSTAR